MRVTNQEPEDKEESEGDKGESIGMVVSEGNGTKVCLGIEYRQMWPKGTWWFIQEKANKRSLGWGA